MSTTIDFAPHVPWLLLWIASGVAVALTVLSFALRAHGAWARALVFLALLFVIANPLIVDETRAPLPDVVAVVVDRSQSMGIQDRKAQEDAALAAIRKQLAAQPNLEVRESAVTTTATGEDNGTQLFAGLNAALADVPPERIAGAILITDGQVHDAPPADKLGLKAPVHCADRRPPRRARPQADRPSTRRASPSSGNWPRWWCGSRISAPKAGGSAAVDVRIDGVSLGTQQVPVGRNATLQVPIRHGGENVVELEARPGPAELTLQNNRAVVTVSGVRDRLRVLLVSGEPHAGERVCATC
ncbi:MAG: hypothetical protein WDN08_12780 [Rhizomicrobium sp.]